VPSTPLILTVDSENKREGPWYTITHGLHVGVTISNLIALGMVSDVSHSAMSKHKTQAQAVATFNEALSFGLVAVLHPWLSFVSFIAFLINLDLFLPAGLLLV
jgi:hypothetical protein